MDRLIDGDSMNLTFQQELNNLSLSDLIALQDILNAGHVHPPILPAVILEINRRINHLMNLYTSENQIKNM